MASTIASKDSVFTLKPKAYISAKVATSEIGMVTTGMIEARTERRKKKMIYLAELSDEEFEWWPANAELPKLAPATIVSKPKLRSVVGSVRKNGWAVSNEEFARGVVGCAVPIRLSNGKLLAGLGVSVPSARTSFEKVTAFLPSLKAVAREIAAASDD